MSDLTVVRPEVIALAKFLGLAERKPLRSTGNIILRELARKAAKPAPPKGHR
jgi:hypothetical protein